MQENLIEAQNEANLLKTRIKIMEGNLSQLTNENEELSDHIRSTSSKFMEENETSKKAQNNEKNESLLEYIEDLKKQIEDMNEKLKRSELYETFETNSVLESDRATVNFNTVSFNTPQREVYKF